MVGFGWNILFYSFFNNMFFLFIDQTQLSIHRWFNVNESFSLIKKNKPTNIANMFPMNE